MADFYRILGVDRQASPVEIREAYLALMKRFHPDAVQGRKNQTATAATSINEAFATLRDSQRRGLYDAEIDAAEDRRVSLRRPALARRRWALPSRPTRRERGIVWAAVLMIPMAAGAAAFVAGVPHSRGGEVGLGIAAEASAAQPPLLQEPPIQSVDIVDAVSDSRWIAAHGLPEDAIRYSQSCFAELILSPNFRLLDRCIVFDLAFQKGLSHRSQAYFLPSSLVARHESGIRLMSADEQSNSERIMRLDRLTVSELAYSLGRRPAELVPPD